MNEEELKGMIDNCICTENAETGANDILYYCKFNDIPKAIEILIKKIKDGNEN
jgi:hypothetical protein